MTSADIKDLIEMAIVAAAIVAIAWIFFGADQRD